MPTPGTYCLVVVPSILAYGTVVTLDGLANLTPRFLFKAGSTSGYRRGHLFQPDQWG
jgi:hypothetical protein